MNLNACFKACWLRYNEIFATAWKFQFVYVTVMYICNCNFFIRSWTLIEISSCPTLPPGGLRFYFAVVPHEPICITYKMTMDVWVGGQQISALPYGSWIKHRHSVSKLCSPHTAAPADPSRGHVLQPLKRHAALRQVAFDVLHYNIITWVSSDLMQSICALMGVRHSQLRPVCKCQELNRDCVIWTAFSICEL